jgi:hypothetical protein
LDSFSRNGQTTVRSWRMIDAEMYGMIPSAKIVTFFMFPPENMSTSPNQFALFCSKKSTRAWALIPGVGTWLPSR